MSQRSRYEKACTIELFLSILYLGERREQKKERTVSREFESFVVSLEEIDGRDTSALLWREGTGRRSSNMSSDNFRQEAVKRKEKSEVRSLVDDFRDSNIRRCAYSDSRKGSRSDGLCENWSSR
jgi:hypothetical protein